MTSKPPSLRITITRRRNKRPLLVCERADGSKTMAETNVGAEHDLAHYAVETTLGYRRAFYGLLASGMDIGDFDVAGASTKIELPPEAGATEFIVGLLEMELISGEAIADFNAELSRAMSNTRKPTAAPVISDADLATMRERVLALKRQWRALPEGESITLDWVAPE